MGRFGGVPIVVPATINYDLVNMRTIAMDQFDKNEGLFIFAVGKLEDMLNEFRAHYYAEEFPPT